jgi:alcohol dehydrogenase (cytochrome c)
MDRHNGQIIGAKPYTEVNWTRGIDHKTGRPIEYDPSKDIQTFAGVGNVVPGEQLKKVCPSILGRQQLLAVVVQPEDQAHLHPGLDGLYDGRDRPHQT